MIIEGFDKYQVIGNPQSLDKTLQKVYIDKIKNHIEVLEELKRHIEHKYLYSEAQDFVKGLIQGINYAIEQLYYDINQLKDK